MKQIVLSGEVGWEITSQGVKRLLDEANGEDVKIVVHSVGGSVQHAFKIYNDIKNYAGKTVAVLSGICASSASYFPLACDEIQIEDNAIFMIHNPYTVAMGDYNQMGKVAKMLEGMRDILSIAYERKSGKTSEEVKTLMDDESYFYGKEIVDAGFADAVVEGKVVEDETIEQEEGEELAVYQNRVKSLVTMRLDDIKDRLKDVESESDYKDMMASLTDIKAVKKEDVNVSNKEKIMTIAEIKAKYPEVCNALVAEGISAERERVEAHFEFSDVVATEKIFENIKSGAKVTDQKVFAVYSKAGMLTKAKAKLEEDKDEAGNILVSDEDRNEGAGAEGKKKDDKGEGAKSAEDKFVEDFTAKLEAQGVK